MRSTERDHVDRLGVRLAMFFMLCLIPGAIILLLLVSAFSSAGSNRWTNKGLFGGSIRNFVFHPTDPNLVFACSGFFFVGGVFRSKDNGVTWQRLSLSDPGGWVFSVRIHRSQPKRMVAASSSVYESFDEGDTWQQIASYPFAEEAVFDMEVSPKNPQVLYAVHRAGNMEIIFTGYHGEQGVRREISLSPFALFETSYTFTGFFSPVDNPPVRNTVRAGAAVPVKFSLGGDQGLAIFSSGYPEEVVRRFSVPYQGAA